MSTHKFAITVRNLGTAALAVMLLTAGVGTVAASNGQTGEGLFTQPLAEGSQGFPGDPAVVRSRLVGVNFDLVGAPGAFADELTLNLFEDATFVATLDRAEVNPAGGFSWIGHVEGVAYSHVALVVKNGVMVGNVTMPGAFYQVRYAGDGVHAVRQIDQAAFPPEADPIRVDAPRDSLGRDVSLADDGSSIDVLVVYTEAARNGAGGTTAMENLIDLAVAESNTGYGNSLVTQRLNLVHTAEVVYDETGFNWSMTLSRLRDTADVYMNDVHTLRDNYCADEVVLIVNDTGYCGMAYLMTSVSPSFESSAFAVVSRVCATGYYSFAHELGHNMGSHHDRANASPPVAYPYSYGYQAPDEAFRTVMAYNCPGGCPRVNHWSNPDVSYGGQPTGVDYTAPNAADNHRSLNNTAPTVANFRDSAMCSSYTISGYARTSSGGGIGGVTVDFGGAQPAVSTDGSGYYARSGFGDGSYTVSFSRSGYAFSPVVDQVVVSGGDAAHDATGYPFTPAGLPFSDGFEGGGLGSAWALETDYEGRALVATGYPHAGSYSLLLDDDTSDGFYSHASAILALDLTGQSQAELSFWWRDFTDEDHADDGVFISDDYGATWYQAFSFNGGTSVFTETVVDLDAQAGAAGMAFNGHFLVKFQFYDNYPIISDGYAIDDVSVQAGGGGGGDHSVYLPLAMRPAVLNGDFESGRDGSWSEYSFQGWALIMQSSSLPVPPRRGSWAAWLGGDHNEVAILSQQVIVPSGGAMLNYWYWSTSQDLCGYDHAYIRFGSTTLRNYDLCGSNCTGEWVFQQIDVAAWQGQTVDLRFVVETDGSLTSNFFLDDVSFSGDAALPGPPILPGAPGLSPVDATATKGGSTGTEVERSK